MKQLVHPTQIPFLIFSTPRKVDWHRGRSFILARSGAHRSTRGSQSCAIFRCPDAENLLTCDFTQGNVLVTEEGVPQLCDFGLSKIVADEIGGMTTSSEAAGSLRWMSPERFRGDTVTTSSDVWAYGMTALVSIRIAVNDNS